MPSGIAFSGSDSPEPDFVCMAAAFFSRRRFRPLCAGLVCMAALFKEPALDIPELLREVNVVTVRVFKAPHLFPQGGDLPGAIVTDIMHGGRRIDTFSAPENRHLQFAQRVVGHGLAFPGFFGVEKFEREAFVQYLVVYGDEVGGGHAVFVENAVDFLKMRIGDLSGIFADLDLRDDLPVGVLLGGQFVYASEDRVALGGDEAFPDAERIDLRALRDDIPDDIFVQRVGDDDLTVGEAGFIEHPARLLGQVGDIARIETDAAAARAAFAEGPDSVRYAAFQGVVGIHEKRCIVGIELAIG